MVENEIGADIRHWRNRSDAAIWAVRVLAAVAAIVLIAVVGRNLLSSPWWSVAGFATDPGLFVRKHVVDYPVCSAWPGGAPSTLGDPNQHLSEGAISTVPVAGREAHIGILLPNNAVISQIYCGAQSGAGRPSECSSAGCDVPVSLLLDDDIYTQGRALTVTITGTDRTVQPGQTFRVWVLWKNGENRRGR